MNGPQAVRTGKFYYLGREVEWSIRHDEVWCDEQIIGWALKEKKGSKEPVSMNPNNILLECEYGWTPMKLMEGESIDDICRRYLNLMDVARVRRLRRSNGYVDTATELSRAINLWGENIRKRVAGQR
jgi:hypothetical protein